MIEMGQLIVHPGEGEIVRHIFADYLVGASLKSIADDLMARKVEYLPGESSWNKSRVKRILEDVRYVPVLINEAAFEAVQRQKNERNDRKTIQPEQHISQVTVPVACAACGAAMTRTHHTRRKIAEAWDCPCGVRVWLADQDLLAGITEILNRLIADPALIIEPPNEPDETQQLEIRRLHNEVGRQMEGSGFDREAVQQDIFTLTAVKFTALPSGPATTYLLRAAFEKSTPLVAFSRELLEATANQVLLGDSSLFIKLKNQQIIGREDGHGSDPGENRADDPGQA